MSTRNLVSEFESYAVLGQCYFASVAEALDNKAVGRVSVELASRGSIRITSMAAVPID